MLIVLNKGRKRVIKEKTRFDKCLRKYFFIFFLFFYILSLKNIFEINALELSGIGKIIRKFQKNFKKNSKM